MNLLTSIVNNFQDKSIVVINCLPQKLQAFIIGLTESNAAPVNIGKKIATYIQSKENLKYISIDTEEYLYNLIKTNNTQIEAFASPVTVIYNLGILFEPDLSLNVSRFIINVSLSNLLVIIWENHYQHPGLLCWHNQNNKICINLSETPHTLIPYEI